jgi:hypothetical protein
MFTAGAYSWLTPTLIILGGVLVAVVVGLVCRGHDGVDPRPGPAAYFFYGLSLVCLIVALIGTGVGVHAATQAIDPSSPSAANFGNFENPPPCPTGGVTTPSTTIPDAELPCINFGDSESGLTTEPSSPSPSGSSVGYVNLVSGPTERDQYISVSASAGFLALAGLIGYLIVWPRSRRAGGESGVDPRWLRQFGVGYGYLVAGLSAMSLLIFVPVAADSVFRAIAPGVNQASGHADGVRGFITFAVLSALSAMVLVFHLRYADRLREPQPPNPDI